MTTTHPTTAIRKAIIPASGFGTGLLPATATVPKALLPVVDRPLLQYAVEEAVRAGITEVAVLRRHGQPDMTAHFFPENDLAVRAATRPAAVHALASLRGLAGRVRLHSLVEPTTPSRSCISISSARSFVGNSAFAVILPDEIVDPTVNMLDRMFVAMAQHGMTVVGVVGDGPDQLAAVQTLLPMPNRACATPSDTGEPRLKQHRMIGRYVFGADIFDVLDELPNGQAGPPDLLRATELLASRGRALAWITHVRWWDCGTYAGYLRAVVELAREHPVHGEAFEQWLQAVFSAPDSGR